MEEKNNIKPIDRQAIKRCEKIIRMFIDTPDPPEDLTNNFHAWLCSDFHCREKEIVMRRLFDEKVTIKLKSENEPDENKNAN